jgi:hypothetical protein
MDVRRLVLESAMDDWVSDYEVQGDFQAEHSVPPAEAYTQMVAVVVDWLRRGVLVAGDLRDGFEIWPGDGAAMSARFARAAAGLTQITLPGQICWFDTGPAAEAELHGGG